MNGQRLELSPTRLIGLVAVMAILGATGAPASMPDLPLPPWIEARIDMPRAPEMGVETELRVHLKALIGEQKSLAYELVLPPGVLVVQGALTGTRSLKVDEVWDVPLRIKVEAPLEGVNVVLNATSRPPVEALDRAVDARFPSDADKRQLGHRLIKGLSVKDVQIRVQGFTSTVDEATLATAPDAAYTARARVAGKDAVFALLEPFPGMKADALVQVRARLQAQLGPLEALRPGRPDDDLSQRVDEMRLERAKLRLHEAVLELTSGRIGPAQKLLEAGWTDPKGWAPGLQVAREMAMAVATAHGGDWARALVRLDRLLARKDLGGTARYVHFAIAELHRSMGHVQSAREHYLRSRQAGPTFTLAKTRLQTLK